VMCPENPELFGQIKKPAQFPRLHAGSLPSEMLGSIYRCRQGS
jgi:hypothetical protein